MRDKLRKMLGFPFDISYVRGYYQQLVVTMYKPLLLVVFCVLLFVFSLILACLYWPDTIGPPEFIPGIQMIHTVFFVVTFITLGVSVGLRKKLYERPRTYVLLSNGYAVCICAWSAILSAYAHYSDIVYTAFVYVMLCASLVSLFRPGTAITVFLSAFALYLILIEAWAPPDRSIVNNAFNAGLAIVLSIIIATVMHHFRADTYYSRRIIAEQNASIRSINERLQKLVYFDELTGLYNRRFFDEIMPSEFVRMREGRHFVGVAMLDVDHFKQYNDHYGHQAGDECLRRVSSALLQATPVETTYLLRYGGEEFVLVSSVDDASQARPLAESLREAVESLGLPHAGMAEGVVTISIGVSLSAPDDCVTLDALVRAADNALYLSKRSGRNKVTFSRAPIS